MSWRFLTSHLIENDETGYAIQLLNGTWCHPIEIRSLAPEDMSFHQQSLLLRSGLEYVHELCCKEHEQEKLALAGLSDP